MKKKIVSLALSLILTVSALAGCGSSASATGTSASAGTKGTSASDESSTSADLSDVTLKVWAFEYTPELFKAAGVDDIPYNLDIVSFSGGNLAYQALAIDQLDLTMGSEIPPLFAAETEGGGNFAIVASYRSSTLGQQLVAGPGQNITSVADLKGKRVGYVEATTAHYFLAKMLEKEGLTWNDIDAVPLSPSDGLSALMSGDIVAFALFGWAQINANEEAGGHLVESAEDILSGNFHYAANLRSLEDEKKRAAMVDFLIRMEKVFRWEAEHIDEYAKITKDYTSFELDVYEKQLTDDFKKQRTEIYTNNTDAIASLQDVHDTLQGLGVLENDLDVSTLFSDALTEDLNAGLKALDK